MRRNAVIKILGLALSAVFAMAVTEAQAQQITGVPGSPGATTTISGKQIPPPDPKFGGVIRKRPRSRKHGGRRASCRRRAHPTCC